MNPLLDDSKQPRFDLIGPEHVVDGLRELLTELGTALEDLETSLEPTWEGLVTPLERIGERMGYSGGIVRHLMGVKNSDALREAYETIQPELVEFSMRIGQSRPIYDGLVAIKSGGEWSKLDATQRRILECLIRDAEHSGVGLEGDAKRRFNEIQQELAETATNFSNHVLDGTKIFALELNDRAEIKGLPPSALALAAQAATDAGHANATPEAGPWRITLDGPSLQPFLQHSKRRDLRETLYRAYITRASTGDLDNQPLIAKILELRREEAGILGFDSYASLSLASKMAPDVTAAENLLEELRSASIDAAKLDLADLKQFAAQQAASEANDLRHWDIGFWSERLREERFAYNDEELRPYFPFERVLEGLFALADRLFDVKIKAADGDVSVWHDDVRFFRVFSRGDEEIAAFYLDPYSRPAEKRGGAWMDECIGRSRGRLPVAYLVCNQTPPIGETPSLMTFREVETLFHEFGHSLQHMLTQVDQGLASGIRNVEWDAVELPSQFMENWCYQRETLLGLSGHFETGEKLPLELFEKIVAARTYRAGSDMLRQLYFALMDLELHSRFDPKQGSAFDVQAKVAEKTTVITPLAEDRFLCSFEHIFSGGYAAGYYSYKWAEVLSADAFGAFEEAGLDNPQAVQETGRRFRDTVLALGGSQSPMEVFVAFRGRAPTTDALLRHSGLAA